MRRCFGRNGGSLAAWTLLNQCRATSSTPTPSANPVPPPSSSTQSAQSESLKKAETVIESKASGRTPLQSGKFVPTGPKITYEVDAKAIQSFEDWSAAHATQCAATDFVKGALTLYVAFSQVMTTATNQGIAAEMSGKPRPPLDLTSTIENIRASENAGVDKSLVPTPEDLITPHFHNLLRQGWNSAMVNPFNVCNSRDAILSAKLAKFTFPSNPAAAPKAIVVLEIVPPAQRITDKFKFFLQRVRFIEEGPFDPVTGRAVGFNERRQVSMMLSRSGNFIIRLAEMADWLRQTFRRKPLDIVIYEPFWERLPAPWNEIADGGISLEKVVEFEFDSTLKKWRINNTYNDDVNLANARARVE